MARAKMIRKVDGFSGEAYLYEVIPAIRYRKDQRDQFTRYVVVSAISFPKETTIFPAGEDGEILCWRELTGSLYGVFDHESALTSAGYEVLV